MDSEEETLYDNENDSGNESSGSDDVDFAMEVESSTTRDRQTDSDDYPYEVLSTEEIVQHMVDCIKDVNSVVEVGCTSVLDHIKPNLFHCYLKIPATTTRILLNHFKWDKEKLMERFYDGDQDQLFTEARVVNPFRKTSIISRAKVTTLTTLILFIISIVFISIIKQIKNLFDTEVS